MAIRDSTNDGVVCVDEHAAAADITIKDPGAGKLVIVEGFQLSQSAAGGLELHFGDAASNDQRWTSNVAAQTITGLGKCKIVGPTAGILKITARVTVANVLDGYINYRIADASSTT